MKLNIIDDKIIAKEVPIYEFKSIVEDIINNNNEENINDIYQLEVLYNRYIDSLRDHYLQLYTDDIKEKGYNINEIYITNKKLSIIKECKAAMSSAIPNNNDIKWNYDGTLLELINDIDQTNDELFGINQIVLSDKKIDKFLSKKMKKRLRWFLSRLILFGINFGQMMLHRKSSIRAANKRLAEVPEFPLL